MNEIKLELIKERKKKQSYLLSKCKLNINGVLPDKDRDKKEQKL